MNEGNAEVKQTEEMLELVVPPKEPNDEPRK